MHFKFSEYYNINNTYEPSIMFGYDDNENKEKVMIDLTFNQFFDRLPKESIEELDKILNYSKQEYINEETWIKYSATHNIVIPKIGKRYDKRVSKYNTGEEEITLIYNKNKKPRKLKFDNANEFFNTNSLNLFDKLAKDNGAEYNLIVHRETIYQNEMELLYAFLDCLFSSSQRFYIRKCKYCKKYYIETLYSTPYCKREYALKKKLIPCGKIKSEIKKTNEYTKFRNSYRNFMEKELSQTDLYKTFLDERDDLIEKCIETRNLTILDNFVNKFKNKYHNDFK